MRMTSPRIAPLDHPFGPPPDNGHLLPVRPPLWRLRLPLPFALDHVNVWLIDGEEGWTIIDTGVADPPTRAIWEGLTQGALARRGVARIVATHMHPDHIGLAGPLAAAAGAPLVTPLAEYLSARLSRLDQGAQSAAADRAFFTAAGAVDIDAALVDRRALYRRIVEPLPRAFTRIRAGDRLHWGGLDWHAITGEGHAVEMLCLHCPALNVLIAADQILPRISPNVSVWPEEPDADPLGLFLASLRQFADLPEDVLVLPSHGEPFLGLHRRLATLAAHHEERLAVALAACHQPATAWAVTRVLFDRPLDAHQRLFALGETIAHLNRLVVEGRLIRDRTGAVTQYLAQ